MSEMKPEDAQIICEIELAEPLSETGSTLLQTRLPWLSQQILAVDISERYLRVYGQGTSQLEQQVRYEVERVCEVTRRFRKRKGFYEHIGSSPRLSPASVFFELQAAGEVLDDGKGGIAYTGRLLQLIQSLDARLQALSRAFGAQEYLYPVSLPLSTIHRAGYLAHFPHHLWLLTHFKQDQNAIDRLASLADEASSLDQLMEKLDSQCAYAERVLSPLVCFHVYQQLADRPFPSKQVLAFTAMSHCMRFEPTGIQGLKRLQDFTMREIVLVGPAEAITKARSQLLEATIELAKSLDLTFSVASASDPFFRVEDTALSTMQQLTGLKYELLVDLGFGESPLAISSFNLHGDTFIRKFSIGESGENLYTCCVGFGLERWALTFLCLHGLSSSDWLDQRKSKEVLL